jgi:hypothetical protein
MLAWRCITPLGEPVVPELYSQNAGESGPVGATGASERSVKSDQPCTGSPPAATASPIATALRSSDGPAAMGPRCPP